MRFAIINRSGNVLEWFDNARLATIALEEMREPPEADVDLVAFQDDGSPLRTLVWSDREPLSTAGGIGITITSSTVETGGIREALREPFVNETDSRDRTAALAS